MNLNLSAYDLSILHTILLRVIAQPKDTHRQKLQHEPRWIMSFMVSDNTIYDTGFREIISEEYADKFEQATEVRTFDNHRQLLTINEEYSSLPKLAGYPTYFLIQA